MRRNFVARYPTPAIKAIYPQFAQSNDPEHRWVTFYWSEHGISYNTKLVPAAKAPVDIANPAATTAADNAFNLMLFVIAFMFSVSPIKKNQFCVSTTSNRITKKL